MPTLLNDTTGVAVLIRDKSRFLLGEIHLDGKPPSVPWVRQTSQKGYFTGRRRLQVQSSPLPDARLPDGGLARQTYGGQGSQVGFRWTHNPDFIGKPWTRERLPQPNNDIIRLDTLEALCNEDFCFGSKGFADYGDDAKAVFFLKEHDSLGRCNGAQETPTVLE